LAQLTANPGVSIVVCCHNSAGRLPETLAHLARQRATGIPWEVIVVDNASTDGTAEVARRLWPELPPAPLRIVRESRLGLSYARQRGLAEARYELVSFVDDDNWVCSGWVQTAHEIMASHPDVGACGGFNEAEFETPAVPQWFQEYQGCYSVGAQGSAPGDVTWTRDWLWGAGLTVRQSAWRALADAGFRPRLVDRRGVALTSGGDHELCAALRLAGWRLWYDPRLCLMHFLPSFRLTWKYLRRLHRGSGPATVGLDAYNAALQRAPQTPKDRLKRTWTGQVLIALRCLARNGAGLLAHGRPSEGNRRVLNVEFWFGRLAELLTKRHAYERALAEVAHARWRRVSVRPEDR
jgi:glycosyltransferase involved in cell wall biosynthesis